jgi:hypothetical protein
MLRFSNGTRLLTLSALALRVYGQASNPVQISTDRPDATESAIVVPPGSIQMEDGITWTDSRRQGQLGVCQSLVRVGLGASFEARIALPALSYDLSAKPRALGSSDTSAGFKYQLGPIAGDIDLSVIAAVSVPSGSSSRTSHRLDPFIKFPWSKAVGKRWSVGGMGSVFWTTEGGRRNFTWEPTFEVQREVGKAAYVFVEYLGDYPQRGGARQTVHVGAAYRITPTRQIDVHTGYGLTPATPGRFFAIGYSFRLDHVWGNRT